MWRFEVWRFEEYGFSIENEIRHAQLRPKGAGGGSNSPRGITAARPLFFIVRFGAMPLGFIDIGDLKCLRCFLGL